jgi:hypothetical protein
MGYQTYFQLEVKGPINLTCPTCGHEGEYDHKKLISNFLDYDPFEEPCKWYDINEDMKKYSNQFPDVLFTINGEGEESGDIWCTYFKNGKRQEEIAEIQTAPFDESKLK